MRNQNLVTAALVLFASATATAGKIKVPAQYPTIQSAVDHAGAGDTILVSPGEYVENVLVPPGKDGLRLRGKGKGVVSIEPVSAGPVVRVDAPDVRIENITVRDAILSGSGTSAGILAYGDGLRLKNVTAARCKYGFLMYGQSCVVTACRALGGSYGFRVTGDAELVKCEAFHCSFYGYDASGGGVVLEKCTFRGYRGVRMWANDSRIVKCVIRASSKGLIMHADRTEVVDNVFEGCQEAGIEVGGGLESIIHDNEIIACGVGIDVDGSSHSLRENAARNCGHDGFRIEGDGHVLVENLAVGCRMDGFDVGQGANDVELIENAAVGNHAEGIENSGAGTRIVKNAAKGNRIDVANDGTLAEFDKNAFVTGGETTAPEID